MVLTTTRVVFVASEFIRIRRSGLTGNNLGGKIFAAEIPENELHNVYPMVTDQEALTGIRDYQGLYVINQHKSVTAKGLIMFSEGTSYTGDDIKYGLDPAGVGDGDTFGRAQTIANKGTTPSNVIFKSGKNRTDQNVLVFPDLPPLKAVLVWFERSVNVNANSVEDNKMKVIIDTTNIVGDYGLVTDPGTSTIAVTGQTEINTDLSWLCNIMSLERILDNVFFLGNTTTNQDTSQWINNFSTFLLKDICKFIFGFLDVSTLSKRNQIINGVDPNASAGYQTHNQKNVNVTILDTSGYQKYTNPSVHYSKIIEFLDNAKKDPQIDFIIAMMGTTAYASLPNNDPDPKVKIDTDLRKFYHSIFTQYGVHVVVGSGINNYQRMDVLGYNDVAPDAPNQLLTSYQPNYIIPLGDKNFKTGSLYLSVGTGGKQPIHNIPTPKAYMRFGYVPKGVGYLKFYTTQRTVTDPPILEGRFFDYYADAATQSNVNPSKTLHLIDRFTITFESETDPTVTPGPD